MMLVSPSTAALRGTVMFTLSVFFLKVVTPWEVEAADEIDYSKLVRSFGYAATLYKHNILNCEHYFSLRHLT